jgi:hypothetical protein
MERSLRISEHLKNSQLGISDFNLTHNLALLEKFSLEGGGRHGYQPPSRFEPLLESDAEWHEPVLLHGDRVVPIGGRSSERGEVPLIGENAALPDESGIEREVLICLQATRTVSSIRAQLPTAPHFDEFGVEHYHTFDFSYRTKSGRRVGLAVKAAHKKEEVKETLDNVKVHPDFDILLDKVAVITDLDVAGGPFANAWTIFMERLNFDPAEYRKALLMISKIRGEVRFASLLKDAPSEGARRTAIWNLIYTGCLFPVHTGPITDRSMLRAELKFIAQEFANARRDV